MDRKKTILIAVFINAGVLAVLFIAALTMREEALPESAVVESALPKFDLEAPVKPPLSEERLDLSASPPPPLSPVLTAPLAEEGKLQELLPLPSPKGEEPIVHKLPPLVPEVLSTPSVPQIQAELPYLEVAVKKGETLDKIAKAHHTTVDEIIKLNQLPSSFLRIGQVLKIPVEKTLNPLVVKPKPSLPVERMGGPEYYTVKVGDNPWTIARKHHMKVEELLRLNSLNEEKARKLKPGDRLRTR